MHSIKCGLLLHVWRGLPLSLYICLLVTSVIFAKAFEPIEMAFGVWTGRGTLGVILGHAQSITFTSFARGSSDAAAGYQHCIAIRFYGVSSSVHSIGSSLTPDACITWAISLAERAGVMYRRFRNELFAPATTGTRHFRAACFTIYAAPPATFPLSLEM